MTDRDNHRGRETAPSSAGVSSTAKSEFSYTLNARAHARARVLVSKFPPIVLLEAFGLSIIMPIAEVEMLIDDLVEAHSVVCGYPPSGQGGAYEAS